MAQAKGGAPANNPISEIALAIFVIVLILILLMLMEMPNWVINLSISLNINPFQNSRQYFYLKLVVSTYWRQL